MANYGNIRILFESLQQKLNEAVTEVPVIIGKDVVGTIDSRDASTIDHIKSLVSSASSKEAVITFLISLGYPADQAEILFSAISRGSDIKVVSEYLLNRTISMSSLLNNVSDANSINSSIGVTKASAQFYAFSWRTSPPMGPGEVWLSTILKDGRRPSGGEKGDVIVDDLELEVKGPNGRLIGQSGYGDAKQMRNKLATAVSNISKNLKVNHEVIDSGKDNFWNIGKSAGSGLEENLKAIAKQLKGGFSKSDLSMISMEIISAYSNYLLNLDVKKYGSILVDVISKDGHINPTKWHVEMLTMYFEYYHSQEHFDYIAFTTSNGKFLIMDVSSFKSFYSNGSIVATSVPSFTNAAGSQGGTYGISLK